MTRVCLHPPSTCCTCRRRRRTGDVAAVTRRRTTCTLLVCASMSRRCLRTCVTHSLRAIRRSLMRPAADVVGRPPPSQIIPTPPPPPPAWGRRAGPQIALIHSYTRTHAYGRMCTSSPCHVVHFRHGLQKYGLQNRPSHSAFAVVKLFNY